MFGCFSPRALIGRFLVKTRQPASSLIDRLDYNRLTHTLRITFKHGEVYNYRGVPRSVARELEMASDGARSVGRTFNTYVRGQFRFQRA